MSKQDKSLPKPPVTPFGQKKHFERENDQTSLLADELALAMARGTLDDFIKKEIPDNEHARKLVEMMMGMTGMMPSVIMPKGDKADEQSPPREAKSDSVPDDVMKAVLSGDTNNVMELLKREHEQRNPDSRLTTEREEQKAALHEISPEERATIESLRKIASENDITVDWIVMRALKVYIQEYQKSGKL